MIIGCSWKSIIIIHSIAIVFNIIDVAIFKSPQPVSPIASYRYIAN